MRISILKRTLLAVCLAFSCVFAAASLAFATEGVDGSVSITANKEEIKAGDKVDLTISLNAKTDPVGSVNLTVDLPEGLEYVSHEVLVQASDYMMSSYTPATGVFGCGVTPAGKTDEFSVLRITVQAADDLAADQTIEVKLGNFSKVDGETMMDFGTVTPLTLFLAHTHSFTVPGFDASGHWNECDGADCTEKDAVVEHGYGEWTVTEPATETEAGEKQRSCSTCGYVQTEVIPASGAGDDGSDDDGNQGGNAGDGDQSGNTGEGDGADNSDATDKDQSGDSTPSSDDKKADSTPGKKDTIPQTGDGLGFAAAGFGMLAAVAAACVVLVRRKGLIG